MRDSVPLPQAMAELTPDEALAALVRDSRPRRMLVMRTASAACLTPEFFRQVLELRTWEVPFETIKENPSFQGPAAAAAVEAVMSRLDAALRSRVSPPQLAPEVNLLRWAAERGGMEPPAVRALALRALAERAPAGLRDIRPHLACLLLGFPGLDDSTNRELHALVEAYVLGADYDEGPLCMEMSQCAVYLAAHPEVSPRALLLLAQDDRLRAAHDLMCDLPAVLSSDAILEALLDHASLDLLCKLGRSGPQWVVVRVLHELVRDFPARTLGVLRELRGLRTDIDLSPEEMLPLLTAPNSEIRMEAMLLQARQTRTPDGRAEGLGFGSRVMTRPHGKAQSKRSTAHKRPP